MLQHARVLFELSSQPRVAEGLTDHIGTLVCGDDEDSVGEFMRAFMWLNKPVLLQGRADKWKAFNDWGLVSEEVCPNCRKKGRVRKLNLDKLANEYGEGEVCAARCWEKEFSDQPRTTMTFSEYRHKASFHSSSSSPSRDLWCEGCWDDLCLSFSSKQLPLNELKSHISKDRENANEGNLYVKDWHFFLGFPDSDVYSVPPELRHDWYNDAFDPLCREKNDSEVVPTDDFRFVYVGPSGRFLLWVCLPAFLSLSHSLSAPPTCTYVCVVSSLSSFNPSRFLSLSLPIVKARGPHVIGMYMAPTAGHPISLGRSSGSCFLLLSVPILWTSK